MLFGLILAIATSGSAMGTDLVGSVWRPSFMSAAELIPGVKMVVNFNPDGKITGSGGCNQFFGGYSVTGNTIKIGPIASTRKGCPGLIGVEAAFFAMLESAKSFEELNGTLILYDITGAKVLELAREGTPE
jgi:putative lipoprotein